MNTTYTKVRVELHRRFHRGNFRNRIFKQTLKVCFILVTACLFYSNLNTLNAQAPQYYNSTVVASTNSFPLNTTASNKVQWIYGPSVFNTGGTGVGAPAYSGNITRIYFRTSTTATPTYTNFTISLGQVVGTNINFGTVGATPTPYVTGLTQCFYMSSYTLTNIGTNNWRYIDLQTPFLYDPNLALIFEMQVSAGTGLSVQQSTLAGQNQRIYGLYGSASGTANTSLVNFGVDLSAATPCTGTPVPGNTTASISNPVCPADLVTLGIENFATLGSGVTFQWQTAPSSGGPWTNIFGATNAIYTSSFASSIWVRCSVTCTNSSLSDFTNPYQIVTPLGGPMSGPFTINSALATGGTNYQTFSAAIADLICRGVGGPVTFNVNVSSGPYNEQVSIPAIGGASSTNTITFNGNGRTLTYAASLSTAPHTLLLNGADWLRFNNLIVTGTGATYALVVHLWNQADNNMFTGCTFNAPANATLTTQVPFSLSGSETLATSTGVGGNNNIVDNCTIFSGYYNTVLVGGPSNIATGNQVKNSFLRDYYFYGSYNSYQNGAIISNNVMERPTRTTLSTFYGVYLTTGCVGMLVEKNRIRKPFTTSLTNTGTAYGVYNLVDGTVGNENRFYNNVISDFEGTGTHYGFYMTGSNYYKVYHNTIAHNFTAAASGASYGIYSSGTTGGIDFRNNIISITRGGSGIKYGNYCTSNVGRTFNNNVYHMASAGTGAQNLGFSVSTGYTTLATWTAATGFDAASVSANPNFTSPATFNYAPTNGVVNNMGVGLGVTTDINHTPRSPVTPDPGAYEFSLTGLDASITYVSPVSPASVGLKTITVNIINTQSITINTLSLSYNDGSGPVTQLFTGLNIVSGSNQNLSFTTQYNLVNSVTLTVSILAVNGIADNIAANNTDTYSICIGLSGAYTINSGAVTGGTNFQSFNAAISALSCGIAGAVTFNVVAGSGPYNEQVEIPQITGASSVATITFNGNGRTLTFNATVSTLPSTFELNGADWIRVNNLNIVGVGTTYALVCHLWNQADNNIFTGCTFSAPANGTSSTQVPFSLSGSKTSATTSGVSGNNNIVDGCTMFSGYYNTCMVGNSAAISTGNQVKNSNLRDYYFYGSYNLYQNGAVISNNFIERPTRTTVSTFYGVYISTGCVGMLVERNRIRKPFGTAPTNTGTAYGIYNLVDGTLGNENRFYNNLISDFYSNGQVIGMYMTGSDFWKAYHNTIAFDHPESNYTSLTYGIYSSGTTGGIDIRNNNISINKGGAGAKHGIYFTSNVGRTCNFNNIHMFSTTGTQSVGFYSVAFPTLANWQTANGGTWDQNSTSEDPLFLDPSLGNYQPTSADIDNTGTPLGIANDLNGTSRSATTPDVGAIEFILVPTDLSPVALVSPMEGNCMTSTEPIVVRIRNAGTTPLNFALNPATITVNVTGGVVATVGATVSSGSLAVNATMLVTMSSTVNMSVLSIYSFNITATVLGDGNILNDAIDAGSITRSFAGGTISIPTTDHCISSPVQMLTSIGSVGANIQWQSYDMTTSGPWVNVGTGGETFSPASMLVNTQYRAIYSCETLNATSNVVSVTVNNPLITGTTPNTRCGAGTVNLGASTGVGNTLDWYGSVTGGALLGSGTSFTTPFIAGTTNYFVEAVAAGGTGGTPVAITEMGIGDPDVLEIQNVSPSPVNVTGWKVAISDDYSLINEVNLNVQTLSGSLSPGQILTWTDATGPNYWGSNMFWNPGAFPSFTGWVMILDNANNIVDFVVWNWPASNIAAMNPIISGVPITIGAKWTGPGIDATTVPATHSLSRQGNQDNDNLSDFAINPTSNATTNPGMTNPFIGFGCSSLRASVAATVTPSTPIVGAVDDDFVCAFNPVNLSVTSANSNYAYTWTSNPSGFAGSGPGPIIANPAAPSVEYQVYGFDAGTLCGAVDYITVNTTPNNIGLVINATPNSVCSGEDVQLVANATLPGYIVGSDCGSGFIDISSTGSPVPGLLEDDSEHNVMIPGGFTFNGVIYTYARLSTNGIIALGSTAGEIGWTNLVLPTTTNTAGNVLLIPYWDDLYPPNGGTINTQLVGNVFIMQYTGLPHISVTTLPINSITFQVQLDLVSGVVRFIYQDVSFGDPLYDAGITATVGIQFDATNAQQYSFDTASLTNGQCISYTPASSGFSYDWSANPTYLSNLYIANPVAENVTSPISYSVTVTDINSGCIKTTTSLIDVLPLPVPSAFSNSPICENSDILLFAFDGISYSWTGPDNFTSSGSIGDAYLFGAQQINTGNYTIDVVGANGCLGTETIYVQVNDNPEPFISTTTEVSCTGFSDGTFQVGVNGGTPFFSFNESTQGQNFSGFYSGLADGTYTIDVTDLNQCVSQFPLYVTITTVPNAAPVIACPADIVVSNTPGLCGAIVNYPTPVGTDVCPIIGTSQIAGLSTGWTFPVGTTVNTFRVTDVENVYTECSFSVTVTEDEDPTIVNCPGNFSSCNPITWTPPTITDNCSGVVINSSHMPGSNFGPGTTTVTYTATDAYNNVSTCSFDVTRYEESTDPTGITSDRDFNNICAGESINLTINGGSLGEAGIWKWFTGTCNGTPLPAFNGMTTINVTPSVTTTYSARAEGLCNNTNCVSITVVVSNSGPPSGVLTITSMPAFGAPGVSGVVTCNAVPGATFYRWTSILGHINAIHFPPGTIGPVETILPTTNVLFNLPQANYQIRVVAGNACGRTNNVSGHIRGTVPATTCLNGPVLACPNTTATYSVSSCQIPGTNGYQWAVTGNAFITAGQGTTTITVAFGAGFTTGTVCVNGVSNFGLAGPQTCLTVSNNTAAPGVITGNDEPCESGLENYTIASVAGATSYLWTTNISGASANGTTTTGSVQFPAGPFSGQVCVQAISSCGMSVATCFNVTSGVAGIPGPIIGPESGICGAIGNYALLTSDANSYNWILPPGVTFASLNGSNSVQLQFPSTPGTHLITVEAFYDCGSATSTITVDGAPGTPTVTPATICAGGTDETYIASAAGADSYIWNTFATSVYEQCTNPNCSNFYVIWDLPGGNFEVVAENLCGQSAIPFSLSTNCRISESGQMNTKVYPNPTTGQLTIEFTSYIGGAYNLTVTDMSGRTILTEDVKANSGHNQHNLNLESANTGMYMLYIKDGNGQISVTKVTVE